MEERTIGGRQYRIQPLPAKLGRKALTRVINRVSPVLADMLEGQDFGAEQDVDLSQLDVTSGIRRIGQELTEDDVDYFCDTFAGYTQVELEPGRGNFSKLSNVFDDAFERRYQDMLQWLWACMEVNFGGFFDDQSGSVLDRAKEAAKAKASA